MLLKDYTVKFIVFAAMIIACLCFVLLCHKRRTKRYFAMSLVIVGLGSLLGLTVLTYFMKPVTDVVTIRALGMKNEEARRDEVYIKGYSVDGVSYPVGDIMVGKWFWKGNTLCWRNEEDPRKPDGITREIVLSIPAGKERYILFESNEWRGLAEIQVNDVSIQADTMLQNSVQIEESQPNTLLWARAKPYGVFLIVLLLVCVLWMILTRENKKRLGAASWIEERPQYLLYLTIAMLQFLLAIRNSEVDCFWNDELFHIGYEVLAEEQNTGLWNHFFAGSVPEPLYRAFFALWYELAPYGERWLLLMPELATAVGIFSSALCAEHCKDSDAGVAAAGVLALSTSVLKQCSYELRCYSFFFCLAAILLHASLLRNENRDNHRKRYIVYMSIAMSMFVLTHEHSVILCGVLFCFDVYLLLKKRIRVSFFIPYLCAAIAFSPVLMAIFSSHAFEMGLGNGWHQIPNLPTIFSLLSWLTGNIRIALFLLLLGAAVSVFAVSQTRAEEDDPQKEHRLVCVVLLFGVMAFFVLYGNFYDRSTTLWRDRYFSDLLPVAAVLSGVGLSYCSDAVQSLLPKVNTMKHRFIAAVLLFSFLITYSTLTNIRVYQPFREAADYIYTQSNTIWNDSTLVVWNSSDIYVLGWDEYYLQQQGRRDPLNVVAQANIKNETDLQDYDVVYTLTLHHALSGYFQDMLDKDFELQSSRTDIGVNCYVRKSA